MPFFNDATAKIVQNNIFLTHAVVSNIFNLNTE